MLTSDVTAALDRTQTSARFSSHIIKQTVTSTLQAAANALGLDNHEVKFKPVYSQSSVRRKRTENRKGIVSEIQENLSNTEKCFVHWDGKLLPDDPGNCENNANKNYIATKLV